MPVDISFLGYIAPVAIFLLVFIFVYAILAKTKLLEEKPIFNIFVSLLVATLFISAAGAIQYIGTITPWFAVLVVSMVFLLMITSFIGDPMKSWNKGIGIVIVIALALVFLICGFMIFSSSIVGYLPGAQFGYNADPAALAAFDWLYSPRVTGAILLIGISALVSWVLVKGADKKK